MGPSRPTREAKCASPALRFRWAPLFRVGGAGRLQWRLGASRGPAKPDWVARQPVASRVGSETQPAQAGFVAAKVAAAPLAAVSTAGPPRRGTEHGIATPALGYPAA